MSWSARSSVLLFFVVSLSFSCHAVASSDSRPARAVLGKELQAAQGMPTPEAVDLEQQGVRYDLVVNGNAVEVKCYAAHRRAASVRIRAEQVGAPELLDRKVRWSEREGAEWTLISESGRLALTAVAEGRNSTPSDIVLQFEGARSLALDALGDLLILTQAGDLHQQRPAVFNANAGPVASRYVLLGGNRVAVEIWTEHTNVANGVDAMWSSGLEFGYGH